MKRCPECNMFYEDYLDVCPTCGERLENYTERNHSYAQNEQPPAHGTRHSEGSDRPNNPYVFESSSGRNVILNGAIAEVSTQQYYQSKFTKFFQAIFSGEPYQLSHTSFVTIFRVEEHTDTGYPEQARDVTLYGSMQNIFTAGDDVTVTARRKGNRLVARNVYNHSIGSNVRIQPNIPAGIIRFFALLICIAVIATVRAVATADYYAMGNVITAYISSLLPVIIGIWLLWYMIKSFFGK